MVLCTGLELHHTSNELLRSMAPPEHNSHFVMNSVHIVPVADLGAWRH